MVFLNNGLLSPGGDQLAVHTRLSGSYEQSATGRADIELDFAARAADRLTATGAARVGGLVHASLRKPALIRSRRNYQPLFVAPGGVTDAEFVLDAQPSIVIDYYK